MRFCILKYFCIIWTVFIIFVKASHESNDPNQSIDSNESNDSIKSEETNESNDSNKSDKSSECEEEYCDPNPQPKTKSCKNCTLPNCRCSGLDIPGGLQMADTPQMIVLTFQNGIRRQELGKYQSLFAATRNPNECPGTGTFFVSHENTDYFTVQTLRSERHEIGVNGVNATHSQDWWKNATAKQWQEEMEGEKKILSLLANISSTDITGMRAPYFQMGEDDQISAMRKSKLVYDSSRVSLNFSDPPNLLWPYTCDCNKTLDCVIAPCPIKPFPGIWEVPILSLTDQSLKKCFTLDECNATTSTEVFMLLYTAFIKHYLSNRAPLVLTLSARWMQDDQKMQGTIDFLTFIRSFEDVYLVSAGRVLAWIKNPTKISDLSNFEPFQCNQTSPSICLESQAITCRYDMNRKFVPEEAAEVRYRTTTCLSVCPKCYPWVNDPQGVKC